MYETPGQSLCGVFQSTDRARPTHLLLAHVAHVLLEHGGRDPTPPERAVHHLHTEESTTSDRKSPVPTLYHMATHHRVDAQQRPVGVVRAHGLVLELLALGQRAVDEAHELRVSANARDLEEGAGVLLAEADTGLAGGFILWVRRSLERRDALDVALVRQRRER
jgi:hypothetical protein